MKRSFGVLIFLLVILVVSYNIYTGQKNAEVTAYSDLQYIQETHVSRQIDYNNYFINTINKPSYVAHRGVISNKPENSLCAFRVSKEMGFDIVETDLHLTKDGQWILIHDYTLDRTTNGRGEIRDYNLGQIRKYTLRSSENETNNKDLLIPTLDEFLALCSEMNVSPILDIKPDETQVSLEEYYSLLDNLNKYGLLHKSIICSYSKGVLSEIRRFDKTISLAVMMDVTQENIDFAKQLDNAFMYNNYKSMTEDKLKLIKDNKLKYGVWTIEDKEDAAYFNNNGSIMIVTDSLLPEQEKNINLVKFEP